MKHELLTVRERGEVIANTVSVTGLINTDRITIDYAISILKFSVLSGIAGDLFSVQLDSAALTIRTSCPNQI